MEFPGAGGKRFYEQQGRASLSSLLSICLLLALGLLGLVTLLVGWSWESLEFHASLETLGAVIALVPVAVALAIQDPTPRDALGIPVICGLGAMGALGLAHAMVPPGDAFVWLHSLAILFGGACFSGNSLAATSKAGLQGIYFVLALVVLISLVAILVPQSVPSMEVDGHFTVTAITINLVGGILFLFSSLTLYWSYRTHAQDQHLLFASVALCMGLSGVLFPLSRIWSDIWWYWHFLLLTGFLMTAGIFLAIVRRGFLASQANAVMLAAISDNANAAIYAKDTQGKYRFVNEYWEATFGLPSEVVLGKSDEDLFPPSMARSLSQRENAVMGQRRAIEFEDALSEPEGRRAFISAKFPLLAENDSLIGLAGIYTDISDRKALEEQLEQLAHFDSLTGLPNRALARDRLLQGIAQAKRNGTRLCVLFLDIDNFKIINDSLGHQAGDELLAALADRLKNTLRGGDTLSRLGGDEFLAVLLDVATREDAVRAANKLLATTRDPFEVVDNSVHSSLSIGLAMYPEDGDSIDQLIQHADTAMYQAKSQGRGCVASYSRQQTTDVTSELRLLSELRGAIENHEFELYWQPQVNLRDGSLSGAEALLRWRKPGSEVILPQYFVPFAETHGLIAALGEWVLVAAIEQIGIWCESTSETSFSINLAPADLADDSFVERTTTLCARHGVDPARVVFEVTEQDVLSSLELGRGNILRLRELGFILSIDDFGTGSSSLLRLKQFPFQELKIDQRFVKGIPQDEESVAIIRATLSMAQALGMQVMTEGVETQQQAGFLLGLGCSRAQGFHFGKPMPVQEFERAWF